VTGVGDGVSEERLRRIEAVTDAALSRLGPRDLLDTLLDRVRELMAVDTAVVLLLDPHAQQLVVTAAKGLDDEVRDGFRLAIGQGFAGRIARGGVPVALEHVAPGDVVSPTMRGKGVCSLLGVPIFARGTVIGVLHVGTLTPRAFDADDVKLLELVADRASLASQAETSSIDRTAALALQRSLLPTSLPELPGLDLAARYVPGHDAGVGGDWYDVFALPSGWLGVVVGDVSGHGLRSAVVMGRLRSALRAYALICADPADALAHLDRKIHHFEAGSLATVLYAMISPDRASVRISVAGHPPPVRASATGEVEWVDAPTDFPLGLGSSPRLRRTTTVPLAVGDVLVLYTDGLIERRGELIDVGLERLRAAIKPGPAEDVCAGLMGSLGIERRADDIALLAVRRDGGSVRRLVLDEPFGVGGIRALRRRIRAAAIDFGLDAAHAADFVTAVNEAMTNAVRHGDAGSAQVRLWVDGELVCEVSDRGPGFAAEEYLRRPQRPTATATGGMGLWIARRTSRAFAIESGPDGTTVTLTA
jgi:anti-sigma regulatory factor (Ser/Thr protein kinase)